MFNKWDIIYSDVRRERYIVIDKSIWDRQLRLQRWSSYSKKFDNIITVSFDTINDEFFKLAKLP